MPFTVTDPTLVVARTGATTNTGTAGATIAGGKALYLDTNDSKYKLLKNNGNVAEAGLNGVVVALHASSDGQPIKFISAGDFYCGAAAGVGEDYYASATAGGLDTGAELTAATNPIRTLVCTGLTNGDMRMVPSYTGAVRP